MAQVTLDTSARRRVEGYVGGANGNDQPLSVTVAEANSKMVVFVTNGQPTAPGLKFNGVDLTLIATEISVVAGLYAYELGGPTVGTYNLVLTRSAGDKDFLVDASVWKGAALTAPTVIKNANSFWNSGDAKAVTIPTEGIAVAGFNCRNDNPNGGNALTPISPQVQLGQQDAVSRLATSYKTTSGATSMGQTWIQAGQQVVTQVIVVLEPAATGSTSVSSSLAASYAISSAMTSVSSDLAAAYGVTAYVSASRAASYGVAGAPASGSFVTDAWINNTGTPRGAIAVSYTWVSLGRIGSLTGKTLTEGTATLSAGSILTATGLPLGAGFMLGAVLGSDATTDDVYYEAGTVA